MVSFIVGAMVGGAVTLVVCGALAACSDRYPGNNDSDALSRVINERDKAYAEIRAQSVRAFRAEKKVAELTAQCETYRRENDKLLMENARLREEDVE